MSDIDKELAAFTFALVNITQRRGSDTAPYQTTDIQLHRFGSGRWDTSRVWKI